MSAWVESEGETVPDIEKKFEDNFVSSSESQSSFSKLEDSDDYLKILGEKILFVYIVCSLANRCCLT